MTNRRKDAVQSTFPHILMLAVYLYLHGRNNIYYDSIILPRVDVRIMKNIVLTITYEYDLNLNLNCTKCALYVRSVSSGFCLLFFFVPFLFSVKINVQLIVNLRLHDERLKNGFDDVNR